MRALVLGGSCVEDVLISLAWTAGLLAVFVPLAVRAYQRTGSG